MEDSQERVRRIDENIEATGESIARLDRNLQTLMDNLKKARNENDNEDRLRIILEERKLKTLQQIKETKQEINQLKEYKLSDVSNIEIERSIFEKGNGVLEKRLNELANDKTILSSFVDRILSLQINEAIEQIDAAQKEMVEQELEHKAIDLQINESQ